MVFKKGNVPWNKGKIGVYSGENNPHYGKKHSSKSLKLMSENRRGKCVGEKNPRWNGGSSFEPYCIKFNPHFKKRVRAFFGYECVKCHKTTEENGRELDVHHVNYDKMVCCNNIKPLFVALCMACNAKANKDREYWEMYYTNLIYNTYGEKCYYSEEEFEEASQ